MPDSNISVNTEILKTAAGALEASAGAVAGGGAADLVGKLAEVAPSIGAMGIPYLVDAAQAGVSHLKNVGDLASNLNDLSTGLNDTADAYDSADGDIADTFGK